MFGADERVVCSEVSGYFFAHSREWLQDPCIREPLELL